MAHPIELVSPSSVVVDEVADLYAAVGWIAYVDDLGPQLRSFVRLS